MQIADFKLERYFARYEFNVKYVMCASDCESFSIEDLLEQDIGERRPAYRDYIARTNAFLPWRPKEAGR